MNKKKMVNNLRKLKCKRSTCICTQSKYGLVSCKRSQAEVIVTVILIMIGIAAVVIVAGFVINLVRNNLKGGECFDTAGQLTINNDGEVTYFDDIHNLVRINIGRGVKSFDLQGIQVTLGNKDTTKAYEIKLVGSGTKIGMASGGDIDLPEPSESRTYNITIGTDLANITKAKVIAIVKDGRLCAESADEREISPKV